MTPLKWSLKSNTTGLYEFKPKKAKFGFKCSFNGNTIIADADILRRLAKEFPKSKSWFETPVSNGRAEIVFYTDCEIEATFMRNWINQ